MDELCIKVTPVEKFSVSIQGHDVGEFKKISSWEGFIKLQGPKGTIIVHDERSWMDKFGEDIFGVATEQSLKVVKITPDLISIDKAE